MKKIFLFLSLFIVLIFVFFTFQKKEKTIGIQVMGKFPKEFRDSIQIAIERYYRFKTIVFPTQQIPSSFFVQLKSPRYRADSIIYYLKRTKPNNCDYIIALTEYDISCTKRDNLGNIKKPVTTYRDWGVLGLGFCPGKSCVVSSFRVKGVPKNKQIERLQKISLHELGHNLGLPHCSTEKCVMRDAAESVKTVDLVAMKLCKKCSNIVSITSKF